MFLKKLRVKRIVVFRMCLLGRFWVMFPVLENGYECCGVELKLWWFTFH